MKKLWTLMAMTIVFASCSQDETESLLNNYTLKGYCDVESRTAFGSPNSNKIPFQWSSGDYIYVGEVQSNGINNNGNSAVFEFTNTPSSDNVYYNIAGNAYNQANVASAQTIGNLGTNGDFGYGTVSNGSFALSHATSYIWFDVTSTLGNTTLETIKVNADVDIAGKATWNGSSFGTVSEGSKTIELSVNQVLSNTNSNVWAIVVLPNLASKSFKVTYKLKVGNATKYYSETITGKSNFTSGKTRKVSLNITNNTPLTDYAELRVLTFEDGSQKWNSYSFSTYSVTDELSNTYQISKWSDLIPATDYGDDMIYSTPDPMYYNYNGKSGYNWYDRGNTMLKHSFPKQSAMDWMTMETYEFYNYQASGHALSNKYTTTVNQDDSFEKEIYAYGTSAHSGTNFCVHHGYLDDWKLENGSQTNLPVLEFGDGIARVIDHMYVNNTVYTYNKLVNGESSFGGNFRPDDEGIFKIVAKGYETANDNNPTTVELKLRDENKQVVSQWTKWDLTGLGKVVKVEFNVVGTDAMLGDYGLIIPAYFAYDDVAVQF